MNWLLIFLLTYVVIYLCYSLILLWLNFKIDDSKQIINTEDLPKISILVAAKNEEDNIIDCLTALAALDYPSDRYEVLIGNDNSSDNTEALVQSFISQKPNFKLINVNQKLGKADAKANVLAHLARVAHGSYFFITDADIQVPSTWAKSLLSYAAPSVGIVSGTTAIAGTGLFARLQNMEWMYAFGMINGARKLNIPVTAVGNNMVVSRTAYESVGGYENIPFSVTEDYQLFKETLTKGWQYENLIDAQSICYSKPTATLAMLMRQRKRWMHGAIHVPKSLGLYLGMQAIYGPILVLGLCCAPLPMLVFANIKMGLQYLFIKRVFKKANIAKPSVTFYMIYEVYSAMISLLTILYFLLPTKVIWKGRKY